MFFLQALGDLVESCLGAIFLDTGFDLNYVWKIMLYLLDPIISLSKLQLNPLRELKELCQFYNWDLQISSLKKDGKFSVEAKVDEGKVSAVASATNISGKAAERMAAREMFEILKAQGYKSKSKPLKEVLRKSEKRDAKLIGYDETSSRETCQSDFTAKVYPINGIPKHVTKNGRKYKPKGTGGPSAVSAKSRLYEICAANCWKPPVFDCCKETGPSHLKEFIIKVVLEMDEMTNETLEFYGEARLKKKEAAEHAAQGALWYLKQEGYIWDKEQNKKSTLTM